VRNLDFYSFLPSLHFSSLMSISPSLPAPAALDSDPDSSPTSSNDPFSRVPSYACNRISLKPCINQSLVDALSPLREYRFTVYGTAPKESISYATGVSSIIGCPEKIETVEQARRLPKVRFSSLCQSQRVS